MSDYPRPRRDGDALHYDAVTFAAVPGYRPLLLDLYVPAGREGPVPCVVWLHGGAWRFGDRRGLPLAWKLSVFDACVSAGLAVATVDYRLSGEAVFPAQLHDVKAAIRHLRANAEPLGLDPGRFGVWGESAGGHLAAMAGLTGDRPELEGEVGLTGHSSAVRAVVDWYGPADLVALREGQPGDADPESRLIGAAVTARPDLAAAASPSSYVTSSAPPFLLVHGDKDPLVPPAQSAALAAALESAGVAAELVLVPDAGHVLDGCDATPYIERSVAFLRDRLT